MPLLYQTATFHLLRNSLWGTEHFPEQYLSSKANKLFSEAISHHLHPFQLLCCFHQEQRILGLFYEDWSLTIDYGEATRLFFEQLQPAKGAGSIYITIQFLGSKDQTPFQLLSATYNTNNLHLFESIAKTIARFTALPLEKVDLGYDV